MFLPRRLSAAALLIAVGTTPCQIAPKLLKDIEAGPASSSPYGFTELPTTTIFLTFKGQVFRTDGTPAGTTLLKRISTNLSGPNNITRLGNKAYIFLDSGNGNGPPEIWETDGTVAGTKRTAQLPNLGTARFPVAAGSKLFFSGAILRTTLHTLWTIDPNATNPTPVQLSPSGSLGVYYARLGDEVVFVPVDPTNGRELWRTDGTPRGTKMIRELATGRADGVFGAAIASSDRVYFVGNDGASGWELWESDGTAAGTKLFKDFNPNGDGWPTILGVSGDYVYAWWRNGSNIELWSVHRRTTASTVIWTGGRPRAGMPFGDGLLFLGWQTPTFTDGTFGGTVTLTTTTSFRADAGLFGPIGSRFAYFRSTTNQLWVTDGTAAGTKRVTTASVELGRPQMSHGMAYFSGRTNANGYEPWVADLGLGHATQIGTGQGVDARVPRLSVTDPVLGQAMTITVDGGVKGAISLLGLSADRSPSFEWKPGAHIYLNVTNLLLIAGVLPGPRSSVPLPIPNDASLRGVRLTLQNLLFGTPARRGHELTNAVYAILGQ